MKSIYVPVFLFLVILCSAPAISFAQPSIQFDSEKHDFGEVAGGVIEHDFEFTNTGNEDLMIEKIVPS